MTKLISLGTDLTLDRTKATAIISSLKTQLSHNYGVSSALIEAGKLTVTIQEYYGNSIETVTVLLKEGELFGSCTCNVAKKKGCKHIASTINNIENYNESLLTLIAPEGYKGLCRQVSEFEKIDEALIPKVLHLYWSPYHGVNVEYRQEYQWLNDEVSLFSAPEILTDEDKIKVLKSKHKADNQDVAVVISHDIEEGYLLRLEKGTPLKNTPERLSRTKEVSLNTLHSFNKQKKGVFDEYLSLINIESDNDRWYGYNDSDIQTTFEVDELDKYVEQILSLADYDKIFYTKDISRSYNTFQQVTIHEEPFNFRYKILDDTDEFVMEAFCELPTGEIIPAQELDVAMVPFVIYQNTLYVTTDFRQGMYINNFFVLGKCKIDADVLPVFMKTIFPRFASNVIQNSVSQKILKTEEPMYKEAHLYISELEKFLLFTPKVIYSDELEYNPLLPNEDGTYDEQTNKISLVQRDKTKELVFLEALKSLHPNFKKTNLDFFSLSIDEFLKDNWFLSLTEKLSELNITLYGVKELKSLKYALSKPVINVSIESSGIDWFDTSIDVVVGDEHINVKDLKKQLLNNKNYIKLSDGKLAQLPEEWVQKLKRYFRLGEVSKDGKLQISKKRFNAMDEFDESQLSPEVLQEIQEKKKRLQNFDTVKHIPIPKNVKATLRGYQKEGFDWLCFLDEFDWGGILADDMGLGKTLQLLTYIQYKINQKVKKPILVVVPTSLLFNWKKEAEKFTPSIKCHLYYGTDRGNFDEALKGNDMIITSYGVLINQPEDFKKTKFELVVLDESQAIKNVNSQRYKACLALKANQKIALSGTPIENNTFELYAQMNVVNKGFLGSMQGFKREYTTPIDTKKDKVISAELQQIISPFVLRRTKETVATELPPKTENIIYCELETKQRKVYDAYRNEMRNSLLKKIEDEGLQKNQMQFLQGLTKLRQICNSPALLSQENYTNESIKIKTLMQHVKEKTGNHKILIFSQFVSMLELIKQELDIAQIGYVQLDGKLSQTKREKVVNEFQQNEDKRIFLISLKAGGTGLNLTQADYVYIVDPWWNPAVENQAIDRCYRIGQTKKVIAYRMICKDTIEEKIMSLKSQKSEISNDIISTDDGIMKKLSKDSINQLLN